ncbi:DMT family transporter [Sediminivirga luteola]|uniref:Uncharacterized protein n=1 Tax=Sediminivirga luteola TaxID=1774748 RepID=A0A8J2TWN9_9MICO|nr:DMT family transporter [Sediminivirga luteola]GGA08982.1 hypothetical protein GCM10011333_09950 [Sediminivirga luteola]
MTTALAILLAALSAGGLAYGAHFQHSAVQALGAQKAQTTPVAQTTQKMRTAPAPEQPQPEPGLRLRRIAALLRSPRWMIGLGFMGAGTALNVGALALAPVMVVQPVGALSLIISVLLGVYVRKVRLPKRVVAAVVICIVGVTAFVTTSAIKATAQLHLGAEAHPLAWITLAVLVPSTLLVALVRRPPQLILIGVAGVLFACVATTVHVVAGQLMHSGLGGVSWFNVLTALGAGLLGSWLVQLAYASGPPETVIAGLTVVDPVIAVLLGALVLGEAAGASLVGLGLMCLFGAAACGGVIVLANYHPDVRVRTAARR